MKLEFTQEYETSGVDTLTQSYSDSWEGAGQFEEASGFMQFMASNDLIFVVLGVSLIIWFVLLFYLVKVDRNVSKLEESLKDKDS